MAEINNNMDSIYKTLWGLYSVYNAGKAAYVFYNSTMELIPYIHAGALITSDITSGAVRDVIKNVKIISAKYIQKPQVLVTRSKDNLVLYLD